MPPTHRTEVVTAFVTRGPEVLVLRRSGRVGTYAGLWAAVSGYLEASDPLEQARTELAEELGLAGEDAALVSRGEPIDIDDPEAGRAWRVHPFRFALAGGREPRLDWEHVEMRWIRPDGIGALATVPGLLAAWEAVAEGPA